MASENQVKFVAAGEGATYWGPGDEVRFLITGEETDGAFCIMENLVAPGGGPPPHVHHREDESFFLLQGTLNINVGDKTFHAAPGDFVHLPRGIAHSFKNTSTQKAIMLVTITPAGLENFFKEVFDPAVAGKLPPQMSEEMKMRAMVAAPKAGLELLMPVAH